MPNLDKTGPKGEGPTGKGRGGCNGAPCPPSQGRGIGFWGDPNKLLSLEEEEKLLEKRLAEVRAEKEAENK